MDPVLCMSVCVDVTKYTFAFIIDMILTVMLISYLMNVYAIELMFISLVTIG